MEMGPSSPTPQRPTPPTPEERERMRMHRRLRFRRRGRIAYIRSVYTLPSLATLGNAICGFAAIYVSVLGATAQYADPWTQFFAHHNFSAAAYLIFLAMVFDAVDGRLARFTRHTTDFGGQLDSLADAVSFGVAPAFIALQLFRQQVPDVPVALSRAVWAAGAVYASCALLRLARFNVSNEHGEQHHFSFLGLPSPGAAGTVAALVLLQRELLHHGAADDGTSALLMLRLAKAVAWALPLVVLATGLMMVSHVRYPHVVNRYLRGKRSLARLVGILSLGLLIIVAHQYVLAIGMLIYTLAGPLSLAYRRLRPRAAETPVA